MGLRSYLLVAVLALGSSVDAYSWSPLLSRRAPLDFSPSKLVKRTYGDPAAYADMLFHYPDGVLDLDSLHSQVVMALPSTDASTIANIRCNPADGTITLSVPVTGASRSSLDKTISALEKEFASAASGWFEGMGTKMDVPTRMSPVDRAACVAMRNTTSDSHIFRTLETFDIRKVVEDAWSGIELKLKTAAADQMDHLRRVVADVTVHMGSQDEKMAAAAKLMKRANYDTFNSAKQYSWNWNNKALTTATPDKIIPFYHGEASLADGSGSGYVDVSCSSCYFWVKGALKVHIDTGTFSIKILTGKAEMYAYFEGAAETMFEVQVTAEGTFKKTWTQLFQTSPLVVDINGILQIGGQVGVELAYSADLQAGSRTDAIVKVGQRFRFDWGVPIDFMNGKGKLPPARSDKLSETTGAANLNVAYKGEAKITPKATVSLDVLHIAGIDLSVGLQVKIPHTVNAVVQGSFNVSAGDAFPTVGVQASLAQCGIAFSYGCFVAPALASKAWLLGITFKVFDYKFPDLKIVQGQGEIKCIQNKTKTATSVPSIGTSTTPLVTSATLSSAAITTTANATSTTLAVSTANATSTDVSVSTVSANETVTTSVFTISANETATATSETATATAPVTPSANDTATVSISTVSANDASSTPIGSTSATTTDSTLSATTGTVTTAANDSSASDASSTPIGSTSATTTDSTISATTGTVTTAANDSSASDASSTPIGSTSATTTDSTISATTGTVTTAANDSSASDASSTPIVSTSATTTDSTLSPSGTVTYAANDSSASSIGAVSGTVSASFAASVSTSAADSTGSGAQSTVVPTGVSSANSVSTSEGGPIVVPTTAGDNLVLTASTSASSAAVATGSANVGVSIVTGTASAAATVTAVASTTSGSGYSTGGVSGSGTSATSTQSEGGYSTGGVVSGVESPTGGSGGYSTGGVVSGVESPTGGSGGYSTGGVVSGVESPTGGSGGYSTGVVSGADAPTTPVVSATTTQAKCRLRPTTTLAYGK